MGSGKTESFSELKQPTIKDKEYENSKILLQTLKMRNLFYMNDPYNFQGVYLLCEIINIRFEVMHKMYEFNPRRSNSASALSSCIERNLSKVIITHPTNREVVQLFEKTLNNKIFLPNFLQSDYHKLNIDERFQVYFKIGYRILLDS